MKAKLISGKFYTNDGELAIIRNADDLAQLVEVKIGYDAAQMVRELAEKADDVQQRLESDLRSYEAQLESQSATLREIDKHVHRLLNLTHRAKITIKDAKDDVKALMLKSLETIRAELRNHL